MQKSFRFTNKKTMAGSISAIALTVLLTGISFIPRGAHGEFDLAAIMQRLDDQQQQIDNHEARITNAEKDIQKTQADTGSTPATDKVPVPVVTTTNTSPAPAPSPTSTPAPNPAPAPAAPTLVKTEHFICTDGTDMPPYPYYHVVFQTYSDGSVVKTTEDGNAWNHGSCQVQGTW